MPKANYRGIVVPAAGDDLLQGVETMAASTLSYTRTQNSESANLLAAQAIADGHNVSAANPMLFLTSVFNQYAHDGAILHSLNMPTYREGTFAGSNQYVTAPVGTHTLYTLNMPAAPYDRVLIVFGMVSLNLGRGSSNQPGWGNLRLSVAGGNSSGRTRLDEGDYQGATVFDMAAVPADVNPDIKLQLQIQGSSMEYALTDVSIANRLMAIGFPINMSGQ